MPPRKQGHDPNERRRRDNEKKFRDFRQAESTSIQQLSNSFSAAQLTSLPLTPIKTPDVSDTSAPQWDSIQHRLDAITNWLNQHPLPPSLKSSRIVFMNPPSLDAVSNGTSLPLELQPEHIGNKLLLDQEHRISSSLNFLSSAGIADHGLHASRKLQLIDSLNRRSAQIKSMKERIWVDQVNAISPWKDTHKVDMAPYLSKPFAEWNPAVLIGYMIVCVSHLFLGTSLQGCDLLLLLVKNLVSSIQASNTAMMPDALQTQIPSRTETILQHLNLDIRCRQYVTCPSCFKTYPFDDTRSDVCDAPCHAVLFKDRKNTDGSTTQVPIRLYLHHELEDWIASLYSRPDIEDLLDRDLRKTSSRNDGAIRDIVEAPVVQDFIGPDGLPFIRAPDRTGRLVFSLNMDGFNPYKNKQAGKKASICAIYMVLLSLPEDIRYRPENIFLVGVIPGPTEPSKEQINYVLEPLIDDLLSIWGKGYYLTSTKKYPIGRPVIGALIPVICDLLAARQISGCASHSSNTFCSFCLLTSKDMNNFNWKSWPCRTREEHLQIAREWKDGDPESRKTLYKKTGIRWSELLRLPYWDPTRYMVIDVMHAFFLGLLRHHVRNIWGMDASKKDGDPLSRHSIKAVSDAKLDTARAAYRSKDYRRLAKSRQSELRALCQELKLPWGGRKQTILQTLVNDSQGILDWEALSGGESDASDDEDESESDDDEAGDKDSHSSDARPGNRRKHTKGLNIIGKETLDEIRRDMASISLPSSASTAPKRPGESKTGKFSADQWKSFCTVNLVVTLGRLWNNPKDDVSKPEVQQKREMYKNFIHLVSAVKLGSMRIMTPQRIRDYTHHIHSYMSTLQKLYPWTGITPYQHISLHLGAMLQQNGPTTGWRCYPFERYNGFLQNILTNNRFGDLERTIFKKFCQGQKLRLAFRAQQIPASLHAVATELQDKLLKSTGSETSTLQEDLFGGMAPIERESYNYRKEQPLPPLWHKALEDRIKRQEKKWGPGVISTHAIHQDSATWQGEIYSKYTSSQRNSNVYYKEADGRWAGRIVGIITHRHPRVDIIHGDEGKETTTFFVLERMKTLQDTVIPDDPYRASSIAGMLFEDARHTGVTVVPLEDILCHFASYSYAIADDKRTILALPLDKW